MLQPIDIWSPIPNASSLLFLPNSGACSIIIVNPLPLPLNCCTLLAKPQLQLWLNAILGLLWYCAHELECCWRATHSPADRPQVKFMSEKVVAINAAWQSVCFSIHVLSCAPSSYYTCSSLSSHLRCFLAFRTLCWSPCFWLTKTTEAARRLLLSGMRFFLLTSSHTPSSNLLHMPLLSLQLLKMNHLCFSLSSQPLLPFRR